jgi:hypothetical protein
MFDLNAMLPWLIVVFVIMFSIPLMIMLVDFLLVIFQRRKKSFIERADDAHVALYKKRKKVAKQNLKDTRLRFLVTLGDEDYYDNGRYGRIKGIIWKNQIVELFVQTRKLQPAMWIKVAKELVRDSLGRNLRVKCNGFEPIGNFAKPLYTRDVIGKVIKVKRWVMQPNPGGYKEVEEDMKLTDYYDQLALENEEYLMTSEKSVEAEEQKVHAMIDAVDTKRRADEMIHRPDFAPQVPGQPPEGKQYDQD